MNICIGGPWNKCKLLGDSHDKSFTVKDKKINRLVTYNKKMIRFKSGMYVFWVLDELSESESNSLINRYLRDYFSNAEIELIGEE